MVLSIQREYQDERDYPTHGKTWEGLLVVLAVPPDDEAGVGMEFLERQH